MFRSSPASRHSTQTPRRLRLESLEARHLLSHPAVVAVNVAGTDWAASFVSNLESSGLGSGGYAIPVGSSTQLEALPWTNINQVRIKFSEDVAVAASDLSVSGVYQTAYAFSGFNYDPNTYTATWTLVAPVAKDKLMLDLDADGMAPVKSVSTGEVLDGAWTDCQSTFNSGNGQGGEDFQFCFSVLPGDVTGNGTVSITDAAAAYQNVGINVGDAGYDIRCDVDGSGGIILGDVSAIMSKVGGMLPSGNPVGMTNDAPTTGGIPDASVSTDLADYVLTLSDLFGDNETPANQLVYSVVQNTNPSLFDSLDINSGELDLGFVDGATGDANLTIRATDTAGLIVDTTFAVHRSAAPIIGNFYCINEISNFWTFTGTVTDTDDAVEGYVVTFGGVLENYHLTTTVGADGVFSLTIELAGLQTGIGTAQTHDPHGVLSNEAADWVIA